MSSLEHEISGYFSEVLSGDRVAGNSEIAAIRRQLSDLRRSESDSFPYRYDWEMAEYAVDWCEQFRHPRGVSAGEPVRLVPAQKSLIATLFGWRRKRDRGRRFKKAAISMGRGGGKSPLAAMLSTMLFAGDVPARHGAEVITAATKRSQSEKYVWKPACEFLTQLDSGSIDGELRLLRNEATLRHAGTVGEFYAMGSDSENEDGGALHGAVIDELHAMRAKHRQLVEKIESGMKGDNSLLIYITTAGDESSKLWVELHHYWRQVLSGIVENDSYLVWLFEMDAGDDIFDPANFPKSNPLIGTSAMSVEAMAEKANEARSNAATRLTWQRYHANMMVSSRAKAITTAEWNCGDNRLSDDLEQYPCWGGLDLGWKHDLASFVLCWEVPNPDDEDLPFYEFRQWSWIPSETDRVLDQPPFLQFKRDGLLTMTEGDVTDHRAIIRQIVECSERYDLQTVAADPNNARSVLTEMVDRHGIQTYEFRQTAQKYNEPFLTLSKLLRSGRVRHGGDNLLSWSADNLVLRTNPDGYVRPDKDKSIEKIDPMVALLMALSEAIYCERTATTSVYEDRDIRVI